MSKIIPLPPFKAFLASNIPSVYDNTLSYYDELTKLIAYMEELVPAVNENTAGLAALKDYVEHYFDNLNVQEEINNKLDEMAAGGQLATIIAQFLAAAPVFGFNTISDMASASNLANGCVAKVLGKTDYHDGDGSFYHIRTRIPADDPDGVNLVAIGATLVGEIIPDAKINSLSNTVSTLNTNLSTAETLISKLDGVFLGTFFDNDSETLRIVVSKDGYNFTRVLDNYQPAVRDPQITYINNKFYICNTYSGSSSIDGRLYVSSDLTNWETKTFSMGISSYDEKWAPEIFVDPDTNDIYFTVSAGNSTTKHLYIAKCDDLDTLTFSNLRQLNVTGNYTIDANISKVNGTYYLAYCEQGTAADGSAISTCKIASSVDLTTWNVINSDVFKSLPFVEGIQIIPINDRFIIIGDATTSYHYYVMCETDSLTDIDTHHRTILAPESLFYMRHGSIAYFNDYNVIKKIVTACGDFNLNLLNKYYESFATGVNLTGTITNLVVQPNVAYRITGDTTITNILNPFRLPFIQFSFAGANNITCAITNVENAEGTIAARNITWSNSSNANEKNFVQSLLGNCYPPYMP